MKHFKKMNIKNLNKVKSGEVFTYITSYGLYRKGIRVSSTKIWMVPIGLGCKTLEEAQKQV